MKNNPPKAFDCVAFKRDAALRLHEKLKGMRPEQERRYWQRRNRAFAARWAAAAKNAEVRRWELK